MLWDSRGSDLPIPQQDLDKKLLRLVALLTRIVDRHPLSTDLQVRMYGGQIENLPRQHRHRPAKEIPDVWFDRVNDATLSLVRIVGGHLLY